jgi:hypothetical protein
MRLTALVVKPNWQDNLEHSTINDVKCLGEVQQYQQ